MEGLPIVVVLVNNGYLGMVTQWQDMFFDGRRSHVHLDESMPDYAKLAEAMGGVGMVVTRREDVRGALEEALALDRTVVVDVRVDPAEQCFPMIPAGAAALDMIEYTDTLETPDAQEGGGIVKHTISVHVEDKPGALTRITSMFARRGFNIDSLAVGPTERPGISRITLRVDCAEHTLEQIEKQIHKLVNVLRVTELVPGESVERELMVLKVSVTPERRAELIGAAEAFRGRVLDIGAEALVLELVGHARGARRVPRAVPAPRHRRAGADGPHRADPGLLADCGARAGRDQLGLSLRESLERSRARSTPGAPRRGRMASTIVLALEAMTGELMAGGATRSLPEIERERNR